ncbi:MAG: hypothetical protein JXA04_02775 [Gammaproteobacteria bacterium]|nr:hypothetical protein [Gammaproteobacteria bacterium]
MIAVPSHPFFENLDPANQRFIESKAGPFRLTVQDINNLIEIATDFEMWDCGLLENYWDESEFAAMQGKARKQATINRVKEKWQLLKESFPEYEKESITVVDRSNKIVFKEKKDNSKMLGSCPVFSPRTRCCNLQTLDAVINCGYDCSYCSIQSFYHNDEIIFHENFRGKLQQIKLDPQLIYHIGTGQSSDSLLWGNRNNVLGDLFEWVRENPNVILELKTKSANISYLLENDVPKNVIVTWSLNAESIVNNEEHRTAPLKSRLVAAEKVANKGVIVGFHLHPIVLFKGWQSEYAELVKSLTTRFNPEQVALVSMGTLTYIKPVIKILRRRKLRSKILQMPFEDAAGKWSYPVKLKQAFFCEIYQYFGAWADKVFFYLCMEDAGLWVPVFGYEHRDNTEFEEAMKSAYRKKIRLAGME